MDTGQSDFHGPSFAPSNMLLDPVISRTPCEGGGGRVPTRRGRVERGALGGGRRYPPLHTRLVDDPRGGPGAIYY